MAKVVEIHCKKYEEWDADTQAIILDKYRMFNVDDDNWYEYELELWADKLAEIGYDVREEKWKDGKKYDSESGKWKFTGERVKYTEINIAFSGFCSQGDGASFTGSVNVLKWIETQEPIKYKRIAKLLRTGALNASAEIKRDRWHNYVHWNTTTLYINWEYGNYKSIDNIGALLEELYTDITADMQQLNKELYRELEKEYDSQISDESVKDALITNEYEFDAQGKMW